ncbi:YceI family protein [Adhaeribacter radiodurans]|uniref:YceI family protein n=1 Tax=Adhaeribacter radiodurans TaxID=2745197 RepID=A0A7L7L4V3_9BACT|nr:YceI family protein [Adhaeribacter radiodurans]QMU27832.1 YceI family protein [Adhaeribacter radiodurans]
MKTLFLGLLTFFSLFLPSIFKDTVKYNYDIDTSKSVIEWSGSSPKVTHQGSFDVSCEGMEVVDGQVKSGTFVIPISSIKNFDLPKALRPVLLKHLKSEDFFNLALFPEAKFEITEVQPLENMSEGGISGANAQVTGNFTMLGKTNPLTFPAKIDLLENQIGVEATFKLDRTQWGMHYAADPELKNRHIYPEVAIHLKVLGNRN